VKHIFGCCYRPPTELASYWDRLLSNLEGVVEQPTESVTLVGDFNVDILNPVRNRALMRVFSGSGLTNYVTTPTRVTPQSATAIDLLASTSKPEGRCEIIPTDISDHFALLARFSLGIIPSNKPPRASRSLHNINWGNFNRDLSEKLSAHCPSDDDLDHSMETWNESIIEVLDKHAPLTAKRKKVRRRCPWLNDELVQLVRKRNKLHKRSAKDPTNAALREQHREARREARRMDRKLKSEYFQDQCSTATPQKLWSVINTVAGRGKSSRDPQASVGDLSNTFGQVVHDGNRPHTLPTPFGPHISNSFGAFQPVTVEEVRKLLRKVKPNKATGSDNIPGLVLRETATALAPSLCALFNASLATGYVPKVFKKSYVSPLFKSGDPSLPTNYRPVSLLPIVSRLLERIVKDQLTSFLSREGLMPHTQFAYRTGKKPDTSGKLLELSWSTCRKRSTESAMPGLLLSFIVWGYQAWS